MTERLMRWSVLVPLLILALASTAQAAGVRAQAAVAQAGVTTPAQLLVELRLKDGSVIYGTVQAESADKVVFKTISGGTLEVERSQIASMAPARGQVVNGEFLPADPNATRLLFSPTGRSLRKGQGYVGVYEFLLPFVQVGVTDRFSVGAGTPLLFFGDQSGRPVWLTPKFQFHDGPRTSAAVGVMHFLVVGESARFGLAYAVATTGTDDNAFTAGVGWAYARYREDRYEPCFAGPVGMLTCPPPRQTVETVGTAVVMLGGEHRVSRRIKLVTENYAFEAGGILSGGVRFLGERLSADLGVFVPLGGGGFFVAPIVNFVWTFGK